MIRLSLLWLFISFLALYAWKDWYKSLCGLIVLTALIEHPDMPRTILNIPGLNPWNLLFIIITVSWFLNRGRENHKWDMPGFISFLLILQIIIFLVGFIRLLSDKSGIEELYYLRTVGLDLLQAGLWNSYLFNMLKWIVPAILMYDGCRNRENFYWGLFSILLMYFILSLLIIKAKPLGSIVDAGSLTKGSLKIDRWTGYHRVDLSMMLAGASWSIIASATLLKNNIYRIICYSASIIVVFAQALTGGRSGYIAWILIGLFLGIVRWRKILIVAPLFALFVVIAIPQIKDRMVVGFGENQGSIENSYNFNYHNQDIDVNTISAGRTEIWQLTYEQIKNAPIFGYGRLSLARLGVFNQAKEKYGEFFGHPHNAYLELLADNGLLGLIIVLMFYLIILKYSFTLLKSRQNTYFFVIGTTTISLVLSQMITSMTSQTFYPRQGNLPMWCAMGLMLRVYVERSRFLGKSITNVQHKFEIWGYGHE